MTSHNDMKWEIGVTNTATGKGTRMCSSDLLHCYAHPRLAVLLNPIHANIANPRLFEVSCSEIIANDNLKMGCKSQTLVKEIELPVFTTEQRIEFAIRCALQVCSDARFRTWAENWLSGEDRSKATADAVWADARSADAAVTAAAWADATDAAATAAAWAADAAALSPKINLIEIAEKL